MWKQSPHNFDQQIFVFIDFYKQPEFRFLYRIKQNGNIFDQFVRNYLNVRKGEHKSKQVIFLSVCLYQCCIGATLVHTEVNI